MYLSHHGIKGQKWGVRRFQNKDGSLTNEGRSRYRSAQRIRKAEKTRNDVDTIINKMSKDDKNKLAIDDGGYLTFEQGSALIHRVLKKEGNTPVSFFDILDDGSTLNLAMGTDPNYRGKGYAKYVTKRGMDYINRNRKRYKGMKVVWGVRADNGPSIAIAKRHGFKYEIGSESDDGKWINYYKQL